MEEVAEFKTEVEGDRRQYQQKILNKHITISSKLECKCLVSPCRETQRVGAQPEAVTGRPEATQDPRVDRQIDAAHQGAGDSERRQQGKFQVASCQASGKVNNIKIMNTKTKRISFALNAVV